MKCWIIRKFATIFIFIVNYKQTAENDVKKMRLKLKTVTYVRKVENVKKRKINVNQRSKMWKTHFCVLNSPPWSVRRIYCTIKTVSHLFGNGPPERRSPPCWLREDWRRLEMEDRGRVIWNFKGRREGADVQIPAAGCIYYIQGNIDGGQR
jgi:hypothetical protein